MNPGSVHALTALPEVLEAIMLVCFGVAWPCASLRLLRTRRAQSNGPVFTLVILCGYLVGASSKMVAAGLGAGLAPVFWLYALNAVSVIVNLGLQIHFGPPYRMHSRAGSTGWLRQRRLAITIRDHALTNGNFSSMNGPSTLRPVPGVLP